jgi:putative IMPACT (imprinted ancient) family translation regulator
LGVDGLEFRANDDGEPSGSAGRPILGQIDSFELTDILVIVVRYFGGTLLGVPGLIQAYKSATQAALVNAEVIHKNVEKNVSLRFDYPQMSDVMHFIKQNSGEIIHQELNLACELTIRLPLSQYQPFMDAIEKMHLVDILNA